MKKSMRQLLKDGFTKTRNEQYDEMSRGEKIGYWIFFGVVFSLVLIGWIVAWK
jgi:hypothetical protein